MAISTYDQIKVAQNENGIPVFTNIVNNKHAQVMNQLNMVPVAEPEETILDTNESGVVAAIRIPSLELQGATGLAVLIASCGEVNTNNINGGISFADKNGIAIAVHQINGENIQILTGKLATGENTHDYYHFGFYIANSYYPIYYAMIDIEYIRQEPVDSSMTTKATVYGIYNPYAMEMGTYPVIEQPEPVAQ